MSSESRLLVIDEGTTGTRALVFDGDGGVHSQSYSEFTQHHPASDRVEHDPEEIWQLTLARLRDALRDSDTAADDLAAIGITNQRATTVLWDRTSGEAVAPAIVWQDLRTASMATRLAAEWGAKVQARTGWTLAPVYSSLSLCWMLENDKDLARRAEAGELAFGTIDSWLVHRLTGGAVHVISASNAAVTGSYDLLGDSWYHDWLGALGLPLHLFPEVVDDSGVIATTAADVVGAEVPIAAAAADQSSALFGQGCVRPGMAKTTHGTGTFLDMNVGREPVISRHGLNSIIAWRRDGVTTYGLEGYAPVTGSAVQWLRDGAELLDSAADSEALARSVDDNHGVYFVPALTGLGAPSWDSSARGLLIGISPGTTRAHLARAALEGIVYSIKDFIELMAEESGRPITAMRADGGASANDFLLQFQADMLGATIHRPVNVEATASGAAYLAGLAVGVWNDPEDCFRGTADDAVFTPSMDEGSREAHYRQWQRAVERAKGWVQS
ncbi:FGGY family carbohydrate kinase [Pseudonocardia acidicola]|uniref:ATP:glycerol 3-phosphotransferase n=1 Tax=Pseudonocardia acidicola TaxID=2724939 RepID=A0ABX1SM70_9PSEU|nr:glycerol kinase GlpK [Pseudonocardia acidicola]NMI01375.1 glycerol kinase GlpK [Pseudonocardia acidicola]